jgi:hypothetical protein
MRRRPMRLVEGHYRRGRGDEGRLSDSVKLKPPLSLHAVII